MDSDVFSGLEQVSATPLPADKPVSDPFQGLESADDAFSGLDPADKLDVTPHKDLISDYSFSPGEYLANNPKVTDEPERLQKLLDVYRAKRAAGLPLADVAKSAVKQAPGIIAKTAVGARDLVQRVGDFAIQPAFNKIAGKLIGDSPEIQRGTMEETGKEQLKAGGEITAGTESAISGLAQLGQQGYRKLAHSVSRGKPMNDSELLNELYVDSEFNKAMKDAASGSGEGAKFAGLDADTLQKNGITLDKDAIENLSLVDPLTIAATGGVFRVLGAGGKILATAASEPAAKMVLSGLEKVASHAQNLAAGTVKLAGKGITAAGSTTEAVGHSMGGLSAVHQLSEGNVLKAVGSMAVPFVAKPVGKGIQAAGRAISEVGESLPAGFIGPKTAAAARLSDIAASAPVQAASNVVGSAAKGAAAGAAAAAPLAAASDNPDTAGGILGGGAALGAAHAALPATAKTAENLIASHYLDPKSVDLSPVKSPGYGVDPNLDAAHEAAMKSISSPERVAINNFREATRNAGGEIYALSQADYTKKLAEMYPNASPEDLQKYSDTHAVFDAPSGDRRVVFLNSDAKGLPHDAGHLFQGLLDPDQQAFLRESVFQNYTPEAIKTFGDAYAARLGQPDYFSKLGETAARNKIADELIAENYSQLFGNNSLEKLAAPKKFLSELGRSVVGWAEGQGLDLTAGRKTPDLNAKPSYQLQNVLRNGAREVLNKVSAKKPTPEPLKLAPGEIPTVPKATPPTPADIAPVPKPTGPTEVGTPSGARNIRATAEHQNDFASARAEDTGIAEAQKAVESDPDTRATVDAISNSMQAGNPALEIEHRGIASERGPGNPEGRTSRRGTQASGYEDLKNLLIENRTNAPEDIVNTHQKTFVPVRWTSQGGKPTLIAMSIDKVISNIHRVVADAAKNNASDLLPYPTENGKLTSAGWQKVVSDVKAYAENQSNGFRGDGQKLVRPTSDIGVSLPAENPDYTPKPLSEAEANFANLVQGITPPETGRATKGTTPGNVKGQLLAEINARQPLTPTVIKPEHITKQGFKEFPGRSVKEMNPLRNELASRGVKVRELHEVTERLAAQDIATVKPRPDLDIKAPVTDTIRAGFLPGDGSVESRGDQIMKTSPEDWVKLTASWKGGLTPEAYRMGLGLKDPADVGRLASLRDSASDQFKAAMKSGDFDNASAFATKAQFFSEAHGAATGTGSAKNGVRMTGFSEPHPFPADENTGSTQAPAEKAGDVQRMQKGELERNFLPASEAPEGSDPITEAAVRTKGGKVFTGSWHGEAMTRFADAVAKGDLNEPLPAGVKTLTDFLDMVQDGSQPAGAIEDGFVTKSGQFLNRAQALDHAEKIGQLKEQQGSGRGSFAKEGLLEANEFKGRRNFLPGDDVRKVAEDYAKKAGIDYRPSRAYGNIDPELSKEIADHYEQAKSDPNDPTVRASYAALSKEVMDQYRAITDAGYTIEPYEGDGEPYKNSAQAVADIRDNKHLYFLQTDKAFGHGGKPSENPMLADSGVVVNGHALPVNDVFRAVHDFFGHGKEGYQFGPRGEFNAWRAHSEMFSPEAQGALAAETLAQNSWVNFGKHLRNAEGNVPAKGEPGHVEHPNRPFAEQKNVSIPSDMIDRARTQASFLPKKLELPEPEEMSMSKGWLSPDGKFYSVPFDGTHESFASRAIQSKTGPYTAADKLMDAKWARVVPTGGASMTAENLSGHSLTNAQRRTLIDFAAGNPDLYRLDFDNGSSRPEVLHRNDDAFNEGFLPKKKVDDQGRPLTKDGLVDYEKLYKHLTAERAKKSDDSGLEKYNIPAKAIPETDRPTGWILPQGKFVPLDSAYHEEFLADNHEALNDQFGTKFGATPDVEDRLSALNSGFVRVRDQGGKTAIELNQKFYRGDTRKAIEDQIEKHLDNIDNLRVSLLDDKGQVTDSQSVKLFDSESPKEDIDAALASLKPAESDRSKGPSDIQRARAMGGDFLPKDRVSPDHKVESEKGYLYHATNEENAEDIARGSLQVHRPDFGTDQDSWPDGSTQKRAYFIDRANQAWHFAPDHGKSVLLRAKQSDQFKKESTGDFFTTKPVPAGSLEILTSGGWRSLSENSSVDSGVSAGDISQKKD